MRNIKKTELSERRSAAVNAKAALLQAYRAAQEAAAPLREARQQEHMELAEARKTRQARREQAKRDEQARLEADIRDRDAAIAAAAQAESAAREQAYDQRITRVLDDEAMRKTMRDQRYASRKARQG